MKKEYDIIYSIGGDCSCASFLRRSKLRMTSGPFDWIKGPSFMERINIIINDFHDFINIEDLEYKETSNDPIKYDLSSNYYINKKNKIHFVHDFPQNQTLEEAFESVKNKYKRRINRFEKNLKENERILLVWNSYFIITQDSDILDGCNKLCKKYNKNIDFLIFEQGEEVTKTQRKEIAPNITRYYIHSKKINQNNNIIVNANEKEYFSILKQYHIAMPLNKCLKYNAYFYTSKIICAFIPAKEVRRKVKNFFGKKIQNL